MPNPLLEGGEDAIDEGGEEGLDRGEVGNERIALGENCREPELELVDAELELEDRDPSFFSAHSFIQWLMISLNLSHRV
jgi:hypothetical protein